MDSPVRERTAHLAQSPERETLTRRVAELTRDCDDARAAAAAERERNGTLVAQCDQLASEVFAWRRRHAGEQEAHAATRERLREVSLQLAQARATIGHMERSRFWRARLAWVRIRRVLRLSA
jgi:hypothetical protein